MIYFYIVIVCISIEDETTDNSCGVRQFAKISFNDKDLLGRLSGKKNTDVTERIVARNVRNKTDGTIHINFLLNLKYLYFKNGCRN